MCVEFERSRSAGSRRRAAGKGLARFELVQKCRQRIRRQLSRMLGCGSQTAECDNEVSRGDIAGLGNTFVGHFHGEQRSACNRSGASLAKKARFCNLAILHPSGQVQHIAAHRIANFDRRSGVGKFSNVAGRFKMIQYSVAEHESSIPSTQCASKWRSDPAIYSCCGLKCVYKRSN